VTNVSQRKTYPPLRQRRYGGSGLNPQTLTAQKKDVHERRSLNSEQLVKKRSNLARRMLMNQSPMERPLPTTPCLSRNMPLVSAEQEDHI
jgi:hypothetical protein